MNLLVAAAAALVEVVVRQLPPLGSKGAGEQELL